VVLNNDMIKAISKTKKINKNKNIQEKNKNNTILTQYLEK
jgi:hypothetical protein